MNEVKRCSGCHKELPLSEFYKNKHSPDGLQAYCKICNKEKHRQYQKANPEKIREKNRQDWAKHRERRITGDQLRADNRKRFVDSLKTPCAKCGESRVYLLQFHHIDPEKKIFEVADGARYHKSKEDVVEEVKKCVCLCANCHKEFHYFYGQLPNSPVEDLKNYLNGGLQVEYTL